MPPLSPSKTALAWPAVPRTYDKPFAAAMDGVCDRWGFRSAHVATFSSDMSRVRALSAMSQQCVSLSTGLHPFSSTFCIPPDRDASEALGMTCLGGTCACAHICIDISWCGGALHMHSCMAMHGQLCSLSDSLTFVSVCVPPRGCVASSPPHTLLSLSSIRRP